MSKKVILTDNSNLSTVLFFNEIRTITVLSKEREKELFEEYFSTKNNKRKEEIQNIIIKANVKWAYSLSKKFTCIGFSQNDLASEALIAMVECFDSFDPSKNMKFATYATFHIQNKLNGFIYSEGKTINDVSSNKLLDKLISKVTSELEQETMYSPSSSEIIERFNKIKPFNLPELTESILHSRYQHKTGVASLDAPFDDTDGGESGECLNDKYDFGSVYADNNIIIHERNNGLDNLLSAILSEREKEIVKYRFGMIDGIEYTNEMIASKMNLTRERVGQIYDKALTKLQNNKEIAIKLLA